MYNLIKVEKIDTAGMGSLSFFEAGRSFPFPIKRLYYIYDVMAGCTRGFHAHKKLRQVLWCPYGAVEILLDNGTKKESVLLDEANKLLVLGLGVWREMHWKVDRSVLCVAVSDYYEEDDYIRDYDVFIKYVREGYWENET